MTIAIAPESEKDRSPQRVRHEVRLRQLEVRRVTRLAPSMTRVTLAGPALEGFTSLGFDDHVKMFFPAPGESRPSLPHIGPEGMELREDQPKPITRDYTPRRYDPAAGELDIDFVLHDEGPASTWAAGVKAGDEAWIAGPRGSFVIPFAFDWYLLIADETGLPALARRLEELPAGARVLAFIEVDGRQDRLPLDTAADATVVWAHRGDAHAGQTGALLQAVQQAEFPAGDYHAWIACESLQAKELRRLLVEERGASPKWVRASGYWRRGATAVHDHHDD
ncbi:siderophore-interacting protein [Labrys portucalensis]|uniref:Siderophore-interacting protein n=1 Tax=Labrys neptuniae TaxID=376174 RepID=A0ABV6ZHF8_9HYPH